MCYVTSKIFEPQHVPQNNFTIYKLLNDRDELEIAFLPPVWASAISKENALRFYSGHYKKSKKSVWGSL
jgi:hypothetical protein